MVKKANKIIGLLATAFIIFSGGLSVNASEDVLYASSNIVNHVDRINSIGLMEDGTPCQVEQTENGLFEVREINAELRAKGQSCLHTMVETDRKTWYTPGNGGICRYRHCVIKSKCTKCGDFASIKTIPQKEGHIYKNKKCIRCGKTKK